MIRPDKIDYSSLLSFVPYCMLLACMSIVLMATFSKRNVHPDEYVHLNAVYYYQDNTVPAKACSAEIISSYSVYGFSRLDKLELSYFLNGKFLSLIKPLPLFDYIKSRFFNVGLFVILLIMSIKISRFRPFALPLLLTPQIWYLFSYTNSEPLSIFISIIAAYLLFDEKSILHQLFNKSLCHFKKIIFIVILSLLGTILLFVKETFYFFFVFIFAATLIKYRQEILSRQFFTFLNDYKWILFGLSLLTLMFSALWFIPHEWVNDFNRENNTLVCRLLTSKPLWSPETPLMETLPTLYLKAKGIPITYLLENNWHVRVFYSAFGYYGYTTIPASFGFYYTIGITFALLICCLFIICLKQARQKNYYPIILFLGMLASFVLIDVAALYKSWAGDFQPQGRYFFSLIAILGIIFYQIKDSIMVNSIAVIWIKILAIALFTLSLYSFIFIGFAEIPKMF